LSKIVADTSVIINGQLIAQIEAGSIKNSEIIIPQAVLMSYNLKRLAKRNRVL